MTQQIDGGWSEFAPPRSPRGSSWHWNPLDLRDLAPIRRELRARLAAAGDTGRARDDDLEVITVVDELMSNALRHGRPPVQVEVVVLPAAGGLLVLVSDTAPEPPKPTSSRDPALGGMGLGMVAVSAAVCGWHTEQGIKTVWALLGAQQPTDSDTAAARHPVCSTPRCRSIVNA